MKRFGNLYHKIYDMDNIRLAHKNARRGKNNYSDVKMVDRDPEKYFVQIHNSLKNKVFKNAQYQVFKRTERGKEREIFKLPYFPDRIIHHCIMQVLEPIWMKTFIRDTYASMAGRGIHDGVIRMKDFLKDNDGTKYCLKLDIKKFYPSVNHDCLKNIIRKKIKCADTLWLLDTIVDSAEGVPIGNYLSQYFANIYLSPFDHWLKEKKNIRYYARYCDDLVILHNDKAFLHSLFSDIRKYMSSELKLEIKSNWQVFPSDERGIDFLGYRFFGKFTLIRKSISKNFKRKIRVFLDDATDIRSCVKSVMSYYGWLIHGNGYNLWISQCRRLLKTRRMCENSLTLRQMNIFLTATNLR